MSLLLDALKQAADSKTQTGREANKIASKKSGVTNTEAEANNATTSSPTISSNQQQNTDLSDSIKLELEEITEDIQQDHELKEPQKEKSIAVEMDCFDPEEPIDNLGGVDEHNSEADYDSSATTIEPNTQEVDLKLEIEEGLDTAQQAKISIPEEEPQSPPSKANIIEKKSRVRAPENAKIILNPDKKPKRTGAIIAIGFLIIAVLAAGGFLGYLYYLEQDNEISSNIANLSRHPTAKIKPIADLSTVSDQISEVNMPPKDSEAANQTLKGNIAKTTADSNDIAKIQQAATEQITQQTKSVKKQTPSSTTIQNNNEISAEELPPTLSSVINSHPFIEHKPLKQLPVAMEQPISIKKNNNEALASKNINLGYKQFEKGNYQLAKKHYQKALNLAPNDTDIFLGLAAIALIENDTDSATELYTKALQIDPKNNTAISAISTLYEKSKSDESTIKKNIEANPNNPWAYFNLGNHHMEEQNWTKALHAFSKANAIAPQTPDILFNIAISLDNLDRVQQAIEAYTMAISAAKYKPANFDPTSVQKYVDSINLQNGNK